MTPDKQKVMLELLETAWVYVHLDPRREGVLLPDFLREQPRVVLQYGYNMPVPISDLTVDERGIGATLSFRRVNYSTFVPWSAVFALTDGDEHGYIWQADVPNDLQLEAPAEPPPPSKPITAAKPSVGGTSGAGTPGKKPRPSHLKLVD